MSTYHQSFPTNGKVVLVADVDGDGVRELIIASTDRVVRVFKWVQNEVKKGLCYPYIEYVGRTVSSPDML